MVGQPAQPFEGVDPRGVSITPVDLNRVAADGLDPHRRDVFRHAVRREEWFTAPLVYAMGAAAGQTKSAHVEQALFTIGPGDGERSGIVLLDLGRSFGVGDRHRQRIESYLECGEGRGP